jgi:zinc protease
MGGYRSLAWLLAAAAWSLGANGRAQEPAPPVVNAPPVERHVLANGLEVLLEPDRDVPNVAVVLGYRAGSLSDPQGLAGLAHLTEHMAFRGSRHASDEQHWLWPQRWGIEGFNAETRLDATLFQGLVPPSQLARLLWLEAERMAFTLESMTDAHVELERRVVQSELGMQAGPGHLVSLHLARVSYPEGHPMHVHGAQRARDDLESLDRQAVQWFFQGAYRPDNATLVLVGNFDPALARQEIERAFAGVRNPATPRIESTPEFVQFLGEGRARFTTPGETEELHVVFSLPEGTFDTEEPVVWLLCCILEARLRERLLRLEPLAADLQVGAPRQPGGERFGVYVSTSRKGVLSKIERVVDEELEALRTQPVDAIELRAQRQHAGWLTLLQTEHTLLRARSLLLERRRRGPARRPSDVVAAMSALDVEQVRDAARRLLPRGRRLVVHVASQPGALSGGEIDSIEGELFRGAGAHQKFPTPRADR